MAAPIGIAAGKAGSDACEELCDREILVSASLLFSDDDMLSDVSVCDAPGKTGLSPARCLQFVADACMQLEFISIRLLRLLVEDGYIRVYTWLIDVGGKGWGRDFLEMLRLCSLPWLPVSRIDSGAFLQQQRDEETGQVRSGQIYKDVRNQRGARKWTEK